MKTHPLGHLSWAGVLIKAPNVNVCHALSQKQNTDDEENYRNIADSISCMVMMFIDICCLALTSYYFLDQPGLGQVLVKASNVNVLTSSQLHPNYINRLLFYYNYVSCVTLPPHYISHNT